jgi:hypothetical protein
MCWKWSKLCSSSRHFEEGKCVASGPTQSVLAALHQPTLVDTFAQLVPEIDTTAIAADIVDVLCSN